MLPHNKVQGSVCQAPVRSQIFKGSDSTHLFFDKPTAYQFVQAGTEDRVDCLRCWCADELFDVCAVEEGRVHSFQ